MFCLRIRSAFRFFSGRTPRGIEAHSEDIFFTCLGEVIKNHIGQKERSRYWRKRLFGVRSAGWRLSGGAVWVVCFCPALEVKEINVNGAQKINGQDCVNLIENETSKKVAFLIQKHFIVQP